MNLKAEKYKIDAPTDVTTTFKTHLSSQVAIQQKYVNFIK